LTEKSTPAIRPLFLLSKAAWGDTPGINWVSCTKLRPFRGSSRTSLPSTTLPTEPEDVSTWTELASTVTCSLTLPTCNTASATAVLETCNSTPLLTTSLKLAFFTATVYTPANNSGTTYSP